MDILVPKLARRFRSLFGLRTDYFVLPAQPVVVVNDHTHETADTVVRSSTSTATLFTTGSDPKKQFYIDGFCLSGTHATDTTVTNTITCTIGGTAQVIAAVNLTALSLTGGISAPAVAKDFSRPLPVDASTAITCTIASDAGRAVIYGHFEDIVP